MMSKRQMLPNAEDTIHLMGFDLYATQQLVFLCCSFQVYFSFFIWYFLTEIWYTSPILLMLPLRHVKVFLT